MDSSHFSKYYKESGQIFLQSWEKLKVNGGQTTETAYRDAPA